LVRTYTTKANIETVIRLSRSAAPVLLEGGTGVGKTATIAAASVQENPTLPLVRFNMSRTVTVDGLLGQVSMSDGKFSFVLQPFAKSFKDGNWLLLDEINLAQDAVLQCIEEAIDTRCLTLHDSSSAANPIMTIPMHEKFRLFATQNPSTGHFKGKREELSQSFTGRFILVMFCELPATEWKDVIFDKLSTAAPSGGNSVLRGVSGDLVDHHIDFNELIRSDIFNENRSYAAVSIRELLQVTQHLVRHLQKGTWPTQADDIKQLIALEVWSTYGSRFRMTESRNAIQGMIRGRWSDLGNQLTSGRIFADKAGVTVGQVTGQAGVNARGVRHLFGGDLLPSRVSAKLVVGFIYQDRVIEEVGLYGGLSRLWHSWLEAAGKDERVVNECAEGRAEAFFVVGATTYLARLRHRHLDSDLLDMFFKSLLEVEPSCHVASNTFATKVKGTMKTWAGVARAPVAATPRTKNVWLQLARALSVQLPILVVGDNGCGKSGAITAIADLFGCWCTQVCLTAETDVSLLVGSQLPEASAEEGKGARIAWKDGLITSAMKAGSWVLLDNINDADPCILERLNPLLEEEIDWRLTERGDVARVAVPKSFRVLATMTASDHSAMSRELSPALSNRFSSVFMPPVPVDQEEFFEEICPIVRAILASPSRKEEEKTAQLCWFLWAGLGPDSSWQEVWRLKEPLNLRALVQFLESAYRLRLHDGMGQAFEIFHEECVGDLSMPAMENLRRKGAGSYHLTDRRAGYARQVCAGVMCGFPVLLEGPAATGKTALITKLAEHWQPKKQTLDRVSNTQTTTIQDYLGSYVPAGEGFEFQKGALYRAMETGAWFLADEFNLADPNVMSMLSPLLEGGRTILVPDSNEAVSAKDGFHFFATQNNAQDYAGRNKLPPSLRSRFMEVEVEDFETEELQEILTRRPVEIRPRKTRTVSDNAARGLASVYDKLKRCNEELRITMRELIKWIKRRFNFHDHQDEDMAWFYSGQALLLPRASTEKSAHVVSSALEEAFGLCDGPGKIVGGCSLGPGGQDDSLRVTVGSVTREVRGCLRNSSLGSDKLPETFIKSLALMFLAIDNNEPIMLVGPTACKSLLVQTWAEITGRAHEVEKCFLSAETESSDLIGQMYPYSLTGALREIKQTSLRVLQRYEATKSHTQPHRQYSSRHGSDPQVAAFGAIGTDEWSSNVIDKAKLLDEAIKTYDAFASTDTNTLLQAEDSDELEMPVDFTHEQDLPNVGIEDSHDGFAQTRPSTVVGGDFDMCSSECSNRVQDSSDDEEGDYTFVRIQATCDLPDAPASPTVGSQAEAPNDTYESATHDDDPDVPGQVIPADTKYEFNTHDDGPDVPAHPSSEDMYKFATHDDDPDVPTQASSKDSYKFATHDDDPDVPTQASSKDSYESATHDDDPEVPAQASSKDSYEFPTHDDDPDVPTQENQSSPPTETKASSSAQVLVESIPGGYEFCVLPAETGTSSDMVEMLRGEEGPCPRQRKIKEDFRTCLDRAHELLTALQRSGNRLDAGGRQLVQRIREIWQALEKANIDSSDPLFVFREGPLTKAVIASKVLFLEDFNLPNQAVTERLNSLLEPERSFTLTEDISRSEDGEGGVGGQAIPVPPGFQVFATVHRGNASARLNISPATRSRFTEIAVQAYSELELRAVLSAVVDKRLSLAPDTLESKNIVEDLMWLQSKPAASGGTNRSCPVDITHLLKVCDFVADTKRRQLSSGEEMKADEALDVRKIVLVGVRFLALDCLESNTAMELARKWNAERQIGASEQLLESLFMDPQGEVLSSPLKWANNGHIKCRYGNVTANAQPLYGQDTEHDSHILTKLLGLQTTSTTVKNIARIFASIAAGAPLLLQGPPGVGKTAVVLAVARVLGSQVERICLSANTTADQLFGTIIPTMVGQRRVFQWQDGKLLAALRSSKWVLLDEINLASAEVLESVAPLLARGIKTFRVPGSAEEIPVDNVIIFGTMNPTSVGGGRTRLPRSLKALFTTVMLDRFKDDELLEIINRSFALLLDASSPGGGEEDWGVITTSQLEKVYRLHRKIIDWVGQRDIGRSGGPFEFNLRDLIKLRDVLEGNAHNMHDHYHFFRPNAASAGEPEQRSSTTHAEPPDVRTLALNKFVSLVYARRFQSRDDQRRVQDLINQAHFLGTSDDFMGMAEPEVDSSVPGMVRIGTVYLTQGTCEAFGESLSAPASLVHSPETIERLEALAAAVQSRRAVLLEGDTCSGKTALVKELARLCKRRLVVIPMTHDIETSDLIGQWLPSTPASQEASKLESCIRELKEASNLLLVYIIPCLSVEDPNPGINELKDTVREAFAVPFPTTQSATEADLRSAIDALARMEEATGACDQPDANVIPPYLRMACTRAATRLKRARKILEKPQAQECQGTHEGIGQEGPKMSFEFVESQLVSAVRQGAWVLLDNINSAPPEVVERLNSLLEDKPSLNLIERGSGEELTRNNGGVHPELRIFATANTRRIRSNKMSSALLNRLLRLWLPPLDS
ncbi:unnamed protein product, partial [Ectocarpus sp. 6 AP-2014]